IAVWSPILPRPLVASSRAVLAAKVASITAFLNSWRRSTSPPVSSKGGAMETDPFRIRGHVARFDEIVADIVARSAQTRADLPAKTDIAYGPGPSETLDLFFPKDMSQPVPVHIFIHGGYWRSFSKDDYSLVASTVTAA